MAEKNRENPVKILAITSLKFTKSKKDPKTNPITQTGNHKTSTNLMSRVKFWNLTSHDELNFLPLDSSMSKMMRKSKEIENGNQETGTDSSNGIDYESVSKRVAI